MSSTLRWGIIGCGDVVERKSGPSLASSQGSRIVSVMRRDAAKAEAYAQENGIEKWSADARVVIEDPEVDIVYVATPPSSHAGYVRAAAAAGKHVLVEKPMAKSAAEAEGMCAACEAAGVQLFAAYYRRFHRHVRHMKRLLSEGALGEPVQAFIDIAQPTPRDVPGFWRIEPEISGGGIFVDVASHRIDAMISLLGPLREATGFAERLDGMQGVEGVACLMLRFESGALCSVTGDYRSGRFSDRFEICGTRGNITADPLDAHIFSLTKDGVGELVIHDEFMAPHAGLVRHIESVLRGETKNQCSGRDALQTERALDIVRRETGTVE